MTLTAPDVILAETWNVYHGTHVDKLAPLLDDGVDAGVGLWMMQEAGGKDIRRMLRDRGLNVATGGEFVIAAAGHLHIVASEIVRLSPVAYYATGSTTPKYGDALRAIVVDEIGRSLDVVSFHDPSNVQANAAGVPRRVEVAVDSVEARGDLAAASQATASLFGGDSNYDHDEGRKVPALDAAIKSSGLRLVQAPRATHGGGREIDRFEIVRGGRLRPVPGSGRVLPGGGDHRRHRRAFRWVAA